jgi:hypothetical protein
VISYGIKVIYREVHSNGPEIIRGGEVGNSGRNRCLAMEPGRSPLFRAVSAATGAPPLLPWLMNLLEVVVVQERSVADRQIGACFEGG